VSLLELTSAYGVFADRGRWRAPTMIRRVVDRNGREIYTAPNTDRPVISEATAYMMSSMMSDVLRYGTAASARSAGFTLHAAGKTGTSQDYSDAWFVGFTPTIVTGVWFGFDKPRPIMKRGFASVVALPAWAHFMTAAMRGQRDEWLDMPASLVKVKICRISGMIATDVCHMPVFEATPYDPSHPEVTATGGTMRPGSVYEDVMRADRVPPPCTMLHGAPANDPLQAPYYDPSLTAPSVQRVAGTRFDVPEVVQPAQSMPISPARPPVAAPPAFMTERPVRTVTTVAPPALARPLEPKAEPETLYPNIPGTTLLKDAPPPAPAPTPDAVVPGSKIDRALPTSPSAVRPPQQ
jgi:membrane peptidoglycan carboxypeptidase